MPSPRQTRGDVDPAVLFERLLLLIHAAGTNIGVRAVAAGNHPHNEEELRYTRRRYFTVEACREVARAIANATFAARQGWLWGDGTTAVASTPPTIPRSTKTSSPSTTRATSGPNEASLSIGQWRPPVRW